jgi:DNA polymerase/3'-5' exonuclease PolX
MSALCGDGSTSMIDIEKLHDDVFNPEESDLEYARRRRRELGLDEGEKRFPLEEAVAVATKFVAYLRKHCSQIQVVGSIRRRRSFVKDIEILLVSKRGGQIDPADLFKHEIARPAADIAIDRLIENGTIQKRPNVDGHFTWGPENKLAVHVRSGIPVDFFSTTEAKWFNSLVVRTGPSKSNIAIASAAKKIGWHWHAYGEGFTRNNGQSSIDRHKVESEEDAFHFVGLPCPPPEKR